MTHRDNPPVVEVRGLRKHSLSGLDLTLAPGERVAIIGESGAGKSVLFSCLLGLTLPEAGSIRILGFPLRGPASLPGLGVAFQQPGLLDAWTAGENLSRPSPSPLSAEKICQRFDEMGLGGISPQTSPITLSGGQQKRLALARALERGTRLILLDEPTSGLDPLTAERVVEVMASRLQEGQRALLMITHSYREALRLCQRILLLKEGRLEDVTPPSSLAPQQADSMLRDRVGQDGQGQMTVAAPPKRASFALRGLLSLLWSFLGQGLLLSTVVMLFLGGLLVAQGSGVSPIDVSRYIPAVVVTGVFREMAPLVVGLLLASRVGARVSAEVAGMSYTAQLSSMRVMGLSPLRRLFIPFALGAAVTFPACILAGAGAAILAGWIIAGQGWSGIHIGSGRFLFLAMEALTPALIMACLLKGVLMGLAVTAVAYHLGSGPIASATHLGNRVTVATVTASIAVVVVDIGLSALFFT